MTKQKFILWSIVGLIMIALSLTAWPASPAQAGSGLPDRNPPASEPDNDEKDSRSPLGAYIELTAAWPSGAASVVQWQDINGDWHNVDGWQGNLAPAGDIRWWVAAKDFGSGPFRWVMGKNISRPFNLPAGAGQTTQVRLTAQP